MLPKPQVGTELTPMELVITRQGAVRYAGASTDFNPIHFSDRHAQAIGLASVVAHGMWTMGAALRIVTDWCQDPGRVLSYQVRFVNPVDIPDDDQGATVLVSARVTEVTECSATIALEARCADRKVLGAAKAEVRYD